MFNRAIVREPSRSMTKGLSEAGLGLPDYELALKQHARYVDALKACGLEVEKLEANEDYPDSTFVEDVALLTKKCAIITRPGAESRRGEEQEMETILRKYYSDIEKVEAPGTVEAGDIMMVGDHFYIGLSERTNEEGARQVIDHMKRYGLSGSVIELKEVLHLKTGVSYLENNTLLACGEFLSKNEFSSFTMIQINEEDAYSANCIWVNGTVLIPSGYPATSKLIKNAGYKIIELDMSEFRKLDGGLSCLSLRF